MKFSVVTGTIVVGLITLGSMGTASAAMISDTISASLEAGSFNDNQVIRYTDTVYRPRNGAVTIDGSVDLGNAGENGTLLLGLIDKGLYDSASNPRFATYQSGAYAYFSNTSPTLAGPTDGNAGGGELLDERVELGSDSSIDFTLTISPDGSLDLAANGQSTAITYGDIKIRPDLETAGFGSSYEYEEFANGAYLSAEFASREDVNADEISYDVTVSPEASASDVPEPSTLFLLAFGLIGVGAAAYRRRAGSDSTIC